MKKTKDLLRELKSLAGPFLDFDLNEVTESPSDLFLQWLNMAIKEGVREPHAMTLSTVDKDGAPDARVLILKDVCCNKWYFASSDRSRKGEQLKLNSKVALTFYWAEIGRQVRIRGVASEMLAEQNAADFLARSNDARAIALIGNQSKEMFKIQDLDKVLLEKKELIKENSELVTLNWKLFEVIADEVEFWNASSDRKHQRVQYIRNGEQWNHHLLWP